MGGLWLMRQGIARVSDLFQIWPRRATVWDGMMTEVTENRVIPDGPTGLGGWLVLVGLGVVLSPFRMVYEAYTVFWPLFADNTLKDVSDPSSPAFVSYLAEFIYAEMFFNVVFMIWSIVNLVWFFAKSAKFPASWRYFLLGNLAFLAGDAAGSTQFMSSAEAFDAATVKTIFQSCVSAAIWVPYTIVSKRVKNTFVN
jgi:hypothetical protein